MSRKYNRSQHVHKTAVEILKQSMRPHPRWLPAFLWKPILWLSSCYFYCLSNGANACERFVNGDCYVEFGSGCYVQAGFPGWWAAVF